MVTMALRSPAEAAPTDADLARAVRTGDIASLGILLERHRAPLHAAALRLLGHGHAEDAVQETFVIALRRIDDVRDPEAVVAWLHAVLRNVCLMSIRRQRARELAEGRTMAQSFAHTEAPMEELIDGLALREWVWTALSTLPAPLQATAMLRWFSSHPSYAEIAAILAVPVGTVRSRLSEARRRLSEALLESAGIDRVGARRAHDRGAELRGGANDDLVRWETYLRTFSEDAVAVCSGRWEMRGRQPVTVAISAQAEAGVELHLTNVIASERVTVLEGRFETLHGDPLRRPHATSQVHFHRPDGLTDRVYLHSAATAREA